MEYSSYHVNVPQWREITVGSHLPAELRRFAEMAHNLWWTWNEDAKSLYSGLNPELWEEAEQNPVLFLERMDYEELEALTHDGNFMRKMENVYSTFKAYLDVEPDHSRPSVAYFSMEYGLDRVLKIYSGGLGILAGDYLKEASDSNVDLCAVGLLYRYGYFDQALAMDGQQQVHYDPQNFGQLPIEKVMQPDGRQLVIHVPYADSFTVHANVWKANVGRVSLYLLDTDNELNSEFDRPITHHLYGGDWENRLKQEILLGIGGMMTLKVLGIEKDVFTIFTEMIPIILLFQMYTRFIIRFTVRLGHPSYIFFQLCTQFIFRYTANGTISILHTYVLKIVQFTKDAHLTKFTDTGQEKKTKIFSLRFQRTEKVAHDATYFSLQLLIVVAIQHRRIIFVYK